jgi:hypothetical protein
VISAVDRSAALPHFDRDSHLGQTQQLVVVLRVPDGECVPCRPAQDVERHAKAGGLADPLRQDHDPAAIEHQDEWELQRANYLQQLWGVVCGRVDDALSCAERDLSAIELLQEPVRNSGGERRRVPAVREMHNRAVLSDDTIDEVEVARNATELPEDPSRHEQHDDPAGASLRDRLAHGRIERISAGDRAVVVEGDDGQLHGVLQGPCAILVQCANGCERAKRGSHLRGCPSNVTVGVLSNLTVRCVAATGVSP